MRKKVVSAGLVCLDVTPVFPPTGKTAGDIFVPGRLVEVGDVELATGGSVANTGLALRKYGLDVTLMGMVGRDPFGRIVVDILEKSGNADGVIVTDKCSTTYSIVLAPPGVDRIFLHFPGSDDVFSYDDLAIQRGLRMVYHHRSIDRRRFEMYRRRFRVAHAQTVRKRRRRADPHVPPGQGAGGDDLARHGGDRPAFRCGEGRLARHS